MMRTKEELNKLKSMDLDYKIHYAEAKILEFYHNTDGMIYVSFSGGKDSTVLLHLVRSILPDTIAVFSNTGLEFPEIVEFVKEFDNIKIIKPKMNFRQVIDVYGYPLVSKDVCDTIYQAKRNPLGFRMTKKLSGTMKGSLYDQSKWAYLLDAPFEMNSKCCQIMKKRPFKDFGKESGLFPIIGTTTSESMLRESGWLKTGCNSFKKGNVKSLPLSIWNDNDIWAYIERFNIKLAKPYSMGYKRTGCVFCAFGAHLEGKTNRFDLLRQTHPNLYEYMMKDKELGGLGFKIPLETVGVQIHNNLQQRLF